MRMRLGMSLLSLWICAATVVQGAALEVGASEENAFGVEGFTLTRIAKPEYGWWPGGQEYFEFAYNKDGVEFEGLIVKPTARGDEETKYPAMIVNHGLGGSARESGMAYGSQAAYRGYVSIAANYTHSSAARAGGARQSGQAEQGQARRGAAPDAAERGDAPRGARQGAEGERGERGERQGAEGERGGGQPRQRPWDTEANYQRIEVMIDALEHMPFVDKDRLYMYGHSMGGFLTIASVTKFDKIKAAAITGAGVGHGAGPDEDSASKALCPVLVMAGSEDRTVSMTFSVRYFDELRTNDKETKLIVFEGEPHQVHGLRIDDVFDAATEWFDAHP